MPAKMTISEIAQIKIRNINLIAYLEERVNNAKNELAQLQENCPHHNRHSQAEYDFTAHWCDDCGKNWSTRH